MQLCKLKIKMFLNKFHCRFIFFSFENPFSIQDLKLFVRLKKKEEDLRDLSVFENDNSIRLNKNLYRFNHVFDHDKSQEEVFNTLNDTDCKNLIFIKSIYFSIYLIFLNPLFFLKAFLNGQNLVYMTSGYTNCGKTYTLIVCFFSFKLLQIIIFLKAFF